MVTKNLASPLLILGCINCADPKKLRNDILELNNEIKNDEYLKAIPSWKKSSLAFHAKDDCAEIREKFFKLIRKSDFKAQVVVARKREDIFRKTHKCKPDLFYADLVSKLFTNRLHLNKDVAVCFAKRGNKNNQNYLSQSILKAKIDFETKWNYKNDSCIQIISNYPSAEPCLQVIDYVNWAVQRAYIKQETRYLEYIQDKISIIWDIYDFANFKRKPGGVIYTAENKFSINKISPL